VFEISSNEIPHAAPPAYERIAPFRPKLRYIKF
jgi:hypothetical protein